VRTTDEEVAGFAKRKARHETIGEIITFAWYAALGGLVLHLLLSFVIATEDWGALEGVLIGALAGGTLIGLTSYKGHYRSAYEEHTAFLERIAEREGEDPEAGS
jgi:hypothetical protein